VYLLRIKNQNDTSLNSNQTESDDQSDDFTTITDQMGNSEKEFEFMNDSSTISSVSSPSTIDSVSLSTNGSVSSPSTIDSVSLSTNGLVSSSTNGSTSPPFEEPYPFLRVKGRDFWSNQQDQLPSEPEEPEESNAEDEGTTMGIEETTISTTSETMVTEGQTETDPIMNSSVTESPVTTQMNSNFSSDSYNSSDSSLMRDDITIVSTPKSLIQEIFG